MTATNTPRKNEPPTPKSNSPKPIKPNPLCVFPKEVKYKGRKQPKYEPFIIQEKDRHEAKFVLPNNIDCSVYNLSCLFLSDVLLKTFANNSNGYAKRFRGKICRDITTSEMLIWFSIVLYMGIV